MSSLFDSVLHSPKGLPVLGTSEDNSCLDALSTVQHSDLGVSWDKSHNSPVPQTPTQPATQSLQTPWIDELRQLNTDTDQRGKSWTLPINPGQEATIPIWTSRDGWMRQVRYAITKTAAGRAAAARHRIGVESMVAVAAAHASSADSKTGRRVTATVQNLAARAGVSESVVKRGRRVLKALHLGFELVRGRTLTTREFQAAEVHHGGRQHRAASVWALSSPPDLVAATPAPPQPKKRGRSHGRTHRPAEHARHTATRGSNPNPQARDRDPLSLSGFSPKGISCREVITKRACARENRPSSSNQTNPRPMNLQRAASALVAAAPVIAPSGHIGAVCDVIERSGINTTRWTGRDIAQALTADTVSRGELWPNAVRSPIGYLTWRLSRLDWSGPSPSEQRATEAARSAQRRAERDAERERARRATASPERRKAFMEQIRATLAPQRQAA